MMQSGKARFEELDGLRSSMLTKAEAFAKVTLPYLLPPTNSNEHYDLMDGTYDSIGARGVNHLANKIMLSMFSSVTPFFRLEVNPKIAQQLVEQLGLDDTQLAEILSQAEVHGIKQLGNLAMRPMLFEVIKHLITLGNVVLDLTEKPRAIGLRDYTVVRSKRGGVIEMVLRDTMCYEELVEELQEFVTAHGYKYSEFRSEPVTFYRWVKKLSPTKWMITQWFNEHKLPDKFHKEYDKEPLPIHALTWVLPVGYNYGVGLIEENFGDLVGMEQVAEALADAGVLASEYRWLLSGTGTLDTDTFENSANGSAHVGNKDDLTLVTTNTTNQISNLLLVKQDYEKRLGTVFLLHSSITRQAERVTQEEIRQQIQELETSLGGVYARLSQDLQSPLVEYILSTDPQLKKLDVSYTIITGIDALSRGADRSRIMGFLSDVAQITNLPDTTAKYLKLSAIFNALAAGNGITKGSYVYSDEEVQQSQQQAQEQAIVNNATNTAAQTAVAANTGESIQ